MDADKADGQLNLAVTLDIILHITSNDQMERKFEMKLMMYNILEGGNLSNGDRTELILELISRADPDIVGLCECTDFDKKNKERFKFFCRQLGMIGIINEASSGHHVSILYKSKLHVIGSSISSVTMYNGLARITVETRELGRIAVITAHLHPFSSWYRVSEAQTLIARVPPAPEAVIMGDMNTISPADLPLDLDNASPMLTARLVGPTGTIDTLPIEAILNHGFIDLAATSRHTTYPTSLSGKREKYGLTVRLDYIFATPRLAERCRAVYVVDDELTQKASDHLPIVAEFSLQ